MKFNYNLRSYLLIPVLFLTFFVQAQKKEDAKRYEVACIGFYNVENLFDTENDPLINDEEYLPDGANAWTPERYQRKLENISKVISLLGTDHTPDGAMIVGLSEIENTRVLEDLVATDNLRDKRYGIVHHDGPDRRGVDVALLYRKDFFTVESSRSIRVSNPADTNFRTRDQLLVTGLLNGQRMHFMVTHWPSRRGGEKASAHLRMLAARVGRRVVDSILTAEPDARIIYMGDLNDDPVNKSVTEGMRAKGTRKLNPGEFFNPMMQPYKEGNGTLAYRDAWNLFDQMLLSPALLDENSKGYRFYKARIFNKAFLRQAEGNFGGYPLRTYVAGRYEGGYSDHFPVYVLLTREI